MLLKNSYQFLNLILVTLVNEVNKRGSDIYVCSRHLDLSFIVNFVVIVVSLTYVEDLCPLEPVSNPLAIFQFLVRP